MLFDFIYGVWVCLGGGVVVVEGECYGCSIKITLHQAVRA